MAQAESAGDSADASARDVAASRDAMAFLLNARETRVVTPAISRYIKTEIRGQREVDDDDITAITISANGHRLSKKSIRAAQDY